MLRLLLFMAKYDWHPDEQVEEALIESAPYLETLSERSLEREFKKLEKRGRLDAVLDLMDHYNITQYVEDVLENMGLL
jgi:tRNA nucleotidyltransferase/poly(A) polymerase